MTERPNSEGTLRSSQRLQGGDERGGYEVSAEKGDRLVNAKLWGIWNFALTKEFCSAVVGCGRALSESPGRSLRTRGSSKRRRRISHASGRTR